jgi:hypothetical protein
VDRMSCTAWKGLEARMKGISRSEEALLEEMRGYDGSVTCDGGDPRRQYTDEEITLVRGMLQRGLLRPVLCAQGGHWHPVLTPQADYALELQRLAGTRIPE